MSISKGLMNNLMCTIKWKFHAAMKKNEEVSMKSN